MDKGRHELDRAFQLIMENFISKGHAPHFTGLAKQLSLTPDEGKAFLHEVIDTRVMPMWLYPGTDLIVSFAPFNNLPNQYAITVDGQQKWFGQWGFEALAVCWVFPGKAVQIDAPCLDCGEPMRIVVKDGIIQTQDPADICGYVDIPLSRWAENWPETWNRINLFRSEEHVRNWTGFVPGTEDAILPAESIMELLSTPRHSAKLKGDYISSAASYTQIFLEKLKEVTKASEFWRPKS